MCRIYVKRTAFRRYHLLKTALPCTEVLWDRRMSETVHRRRNERRSVPPDSWHELDFIAEAPPVLTHDSVEPSEVQPSALLRLAEKLVAEIVDRVRTPPLPSPLTRAAGNEIPNSATRAM